MKCEELLKILSDYVDGDIDPAICSDFEKHLEGCSPCQVVIDNIEHTIALYRNEQPYEMPDDFQRQLRATLKARWKG